MRTPTIKQPDRSDRHGVDEEDGPPTGEEVNRGAYRLGCAITLAALVAIGLIVTGLLWWLGLL